MAATGLEVQRLESQGALVASALSAGASLPERLGFPDWLELPGRLDLTRATTELARVDTNTLTDLGLLSGASGLAWVARGAWTDRLDTARRWLTEVCWLAELGEQWAPDAVIDTTLNFLEARLLALRDSALSGDEVIDQLARTAPEGGQLRLLGAANIKGTGLDFVYRWIGHTEVVAALEGLEKATGTAAARQALGCLRSHKDWGAADSALAADRIAAVVQSGRLRLLGLAQEATATLARVEQVRDEKAAAIGASGGDGPMTVAKRAVESTLDFYDSVRRRREADRLLADLAAGRVGRRRAAEVGRSLVKRQKGGCLFGQGP